MILRRWIFWLALLALATAAFRSLRGYLGEVHVSLLYLLLVLVGSSRGGRALGLTLAALCVGFIDYYFQAPYDTLSVGIGLDWVTLFAFLATATLSTNMLVRAQNEAAEAKQRTEEAKSLSVMGAETLRAASPEDSLATIVVLIQRTLAVAYCSLRPWVAGRGIADASYDATNGSTAELPLSAVPILALTAERGVPHGVCANGESTVLTLGNDGVSLLLRGDVRVLSMPLRVGQSIVGVLALADSQPLHFDAAQSRFLTALAYYAAVAIERQQLAVASAHAAALREANRLKDIVLASVSHDLRTPLTTIKALAQTGAMQGSALGSAIEAQADLLSRLVNDLLDISRLRAHELPMDLQINTAEDLIGAVVRQAHGILDGKRLQVSLDYSAAALLGRFDFVHALRSLGNLVENALRYTPAAGVVDIGATADAEWLSIRVGDRGPGVPAGEREAIFELFYRPECAPPDVGRAGMGLAIAVQLARAQGGDVEYEPRAGGGSVFTLRLQLATISELHDDRTVEQMR
ncbi:MAG: DUF4118 domain-containing protein [Gemmatimonadota bacterium]|nr:DUF4118 domain-containing protein [Gemmatimonadota bacterium]